VLAHFCGVEPGQEGHHREKISMREDKHQHCINEDADDVVEFTGDEMSVDCVVRMGDDIVSPTIKEESSTPEKFDTFVVRQGLALLSINNLSDDKEIDRDSKLGRLCL
jgi:hypothetical protein